jgi:hypothetical protein
VATEHNSTTLFPIPIDLFTPFLKLADAANREAAPGKAQKKEEGGA